MSRFEKLFQKVHRRSSDTSLDPNTPIFLSPNSSNLNTSTSNSATGSLRSRAKSLSLVSSQSNLHGGLYNAKSNDSSVPKTRTSSKSVSRKQTKELIKYETQQVILKKLSVLLNELGLQKPIPLKIDNSNSSSLAKNINIYVANTNNCIYLSPASSASFTYEDAENGGMPQNRATHQELYNDMNEEDNDENSNSHGSSLDNPEVNENDSESVLNDPLDPELDPRDNPNPTIENIPSELREKLESFNSPSYLCSNIDSDTPIPHTFGVIVELNKDTAISHIKFEFASLTNILWPSGDPYNKTFVKENFKIGKLDWIKNLNNADFYLNNLNSSDFKSRKINPDELAKRTRFYKLNSIKDLAKTKYSADNIDDEEEEMAPDLPHADSEEFYDNNSDEQGVCKAGVYLFLLPVLLPEHIPPTITSISGSLHHLLNVSIHKSSEKLNRKLKVATNFNLPMVRTPPSFANSIADKPIYVNRVWNDALHYIITFPRKYVSLGSEHSINVKIVPLVKDVIIKRIKFNVLERITYVSKDLSREYDYDGEDPYYLKPLLNDSKVRERVVSICELKTKNKPSSGYSEPYKEEVIKCPDNNLLFSCYEPTGNSHNGHDDDIESFKLDDAIHQARLNERSKSKDSSPKNGTPKSNNGDSEGVMVASPLDINIALPFLTTKNDKIIQTASNEEELRHLSSTTSPSASRKASIMSTENNSSGNFPPSSPVIGALETNLSHNHNDLLNSEESNDFLTPDSSALMQELSHNYFKENIHHGYTTIGRALYPDTNFRHIQIYHRLQVCFRISKPDPKDNYKMHHYEVVVDTPLILLSSNCNEDSIQLPRYDEVNSENHRTTSLMGSPGLASTTSPTATGSSNHRNDPGVSFRTPQFDGNNTSCSNVGSKVGHSTSHNGQVHGNGFSIKPWNESESTEGLPTFEEATYPMASPVTRSFSVSEDPLSRIPSISIDNGNGENNVMNLNAMPNSNPPAYEEESDDLANPVTIDAVVNQRNRSESGTNLRASKLRSSLVNSFAPSTNLVPPTGSDGATSISPTSSVSFSIPNNGSGDSSSVNRDDVNTNKSLGIDNDEDSEKTESSDASQASESSESHSRMSQSDSQVSLESSEAINTRTHPNENLPPNFDSLDSFQSSGNLPDTSSTAITTEDENQSKHESDLNKSTDNSSLEPGVSDSTSKNELEDKELVGSMNKINIQPEENSPSPLSQDKRTPKGRLLIDSDLESINTSNDGIYQGQNDSEFSLKDRQAGINPINKLTNFPDDSESNISIATHSSSYHQRIPLLRNTSTESSVPLAKQSTITTQNKQSTDDLSVITENNTPQDIYHTY